MGLVEFETLKNYIQTNFANGFIWSSKLSASVFILFVQKLDSNFRLYGNYCSLHNVTIKN